MKNLFRISAICLLSGFLLTACEKEEETKPIAQEKPGQFLTNAEGWTIVGDAQGGYVEASYSPDGGVTDGYIYADDDVTGGVWYFAAPDSYHGDKSNYYGKILSYSIFQKSDRSNQFASDDIIFANGANQIVYVIANYPDTTWTDYTVKLSEEGFWMNDSYNSGDTATEAEIKAVLSNVDKFWIRGEFESGPDSGGLDNVSIK